MVERDEPVIEPGKVLVRVKQLGLCGSDLKTFLGHNPMVSFPRIIGHEIAAEVVDRGRGVPESLSPGTRVTLYPYSSCGTCSSCRRGRTNACRSNETMGVQCDGGATPLLCLPHTNVVPAENLSLDQTALIEPLSVGFHAVRRGAVGPGDTVVVLGCGMIGLGAIVGATRQGAGVVAVDIDEAKLEMARGVGAQTAVNSSTCDLRQAVLDMTRGQGADVVIEAVGRPATYRSAVDVVCYAGIVVYVGYASEPVSYETKDFERKELDIRGSRNGLLADFAAVVEALSAGAVNVGPLITHRFPFDHLGEALRFWKDNPLGVTKIMINDFV